MFLFIHSVMFRCIGSLSGETGAGSGSFSCPQPVGLMQFAQGTLYVLLQNNACPGWDLSVGGTSLAALNLV
jgi:hypothetical protein